MDLSKIFDLISLTALTVSIAANFIKFFVC